MYRMLIVATLAVAYSFPSYGQAKPQKPELTWYTDVKKAHEESAKTNRPIFAFFTGSDWCGWCHRLQANVFAKEEFVAWAKKSVVLLELDFPRRKQLPQELAQQNAELQQVFQVRGYPTVWLFYMTKDSTTNKFNISALGSLGYPQGAQPGKEQLKFLADAESVMKNKS